MATQGWNHVCELDDDGESCIIPEEEDVRVSESI